MHTSIFNENFNIPSFKNIQISQLSEEIAEIIDSNTKQINDLIKNQKKYTWNNFILPMDELNNKLNNVFGVLSHLNSVSNNSEIREAYEESLMQVTQYSDTLMQRQDYCAAVKFVVNNDNLDDIQKYILEKQLLHFKLSGVDLAQQDRDTFLELSQKLSYLSTNFSNNVLDSTNKWQKLITEKSLLSGVPNINMQTFERNAKNRALDGFLLTLDAPCYIAVITYAENRDLREEIYKAYITRASEQADCKDFDNTQNINDILTTRLQLANLLGFESFADYSLATKMAKNPEQVINFLKDIARKARPKAQEELLELANFAQSLNFNDELKPWDIAFFSEKLKQSKFSFNSDKLREYFPVNNVLNGLFKVINELFSVEIRKITNDTWHEDVLTFGIFEQNNLIAYLFLDLYARENKRSGAWMSGAISGFQTASNLYKPVAYVVCNFLKSNVDQLLTFDDVQTLFHEFGHALHHTLTKINYLDASGINGVAWDAVELPSQLMEQFCWNEACLNEIASHYKTKESLPKNIVSNLIASKNFQSALFVIRQIEFALLDMQLHGKIINFQDTLKEVRELVCVIKTTNFNRFTHSFLHIFAGGYSAGYYSYMWADVLANDAFSVFEQQGVFSKSIGEKFKQKILSRGGSKDAMELFIEFTGREPDVDSMLVNIGIIDK